MLFLLSSRGSRILRTYARILRTGPDTPVGKYWVYLPRGRLVPFFSSFFHWCHRPFFFLSLSLALGAIFAFPAHVSYKSLKEEPSPLRKLWGGIGFEVSHAFNFSQGIQTLTRSISQCGWRKWIIFRALSLPLSSNSWFKFRSISMVKSLNFGT
jgi:hypothetical protein